MDKMTETGSCQSHAAERINETNTTVQSLTVINGCYEMSPRDLILRGVVLVLFFKIQTAFGRTHDKCNAVCVRGGVIASIRCLPEGGGEDGLWFCIATMMMKKKTTNRINVVLLANTARVSIRIRDVSSAPHWSVKMQLNECVDSVIHSNASFK